VTDPGSLALAVATLGAAIMAARHIRPQPIVIDHPRWFKSLLWELAPQPGWVLYHPLGRFPERKLDPLPVDAFPENLLPGEGEWLAELRPLPPDERWQRLFGDPKIVRELTSWNRPTPRPQKHLRWGWWGEGSWREAFFQVLSDRGSSPAWKEIEEGVPEHRWVLLTSGEGFREVLRKLKEAPALRDRV